MVELPPPPQMGMLSRYRKGNNLLCFPWFRFSLSQRHRLNGYVINSGIRVWHAFLMRKVEGILVEHSEKVLNGRESSV